MYMFFLTRADLFHMHMPTRVLNGMGEPSRENVNGLVFEAGYCIHTYVRTRGGINDVYGQFQIGGRWHRGYEWVSLPHF